MLGTLLGPEIHELLANRDYRQLREVLEDLPVPDLADVLATVPQVTDRALLFRLLPWARATEVFEHLDGDRQRALLDTLKDSEAARLLNEMSPDDRTDLLEEVPEQVARRVLRLLSDQERAVSLALLAYPEESVGRRMTPKYVKVKANRTCAECIEHLRRVGSDKEILDYVYVVDDDNAPQGVVTLARLVFSPPDRKVGELIDKDQEIVRVRADADQEEAVQLLSRHDLKALPVVSSRGRLLGIVTFDDLMDVQEAEATEDMQLMSGIVPTDSTSYLKTRAIELLPKRLPALALLAVTATFCGKVLEFYSVRLSTFGSLALFVVVLMSASGNTGSQAGTLIIRCLATETVRARDVLVMVGREVMTGALLGGVLGALVAAIGYVSFSGVTGSEAFVVGASLAISVLSCNLVGALVPLLLWRMKFDPAYMATPVITSISDYAALFIYFGMATLLMT